MKPIRHPYLRCNPLEARTAPALVASLFGEFTFLRGIPAGELSIVATADNQIKVTDNQTSLEVTLPVDGDLYIQLFRRSVAPGQGKLTIDLDGFELSGDLLLDLGRGDGNLDPTANPVVIEDGTIAGNVTILRGDGREVIDLKTEIRGTTTVVMNPRGTITTGDKLTIFPGTTLLDNVSAVYVEDIALGSPMAGSPLARVAGDLNLTNPGAAALTAELFGLVQGSVAITGSTNDDKVTIDGNTTLDSGRIDGNLQINLLSGRNMGQLITLGPDAKIGGTTFVRTGSSADQLVVEGELGGSLNVDLGPGADTFAFNAPAMIDGDVILRASAGDHDLTSFDAKVDGNLVIELNGEGDNQFSFGSKASVAGAFRYRALDSANSILLDRIDLGMVMVQVGNDSNSSLLTLDGTNGNKIDQLTVEVGNGGNNIQLVNDFEITGTFTFRGGNGDDSISLDTTNGMNDLNLDLLFGEGDDTLNFSDAILTITGEADGGGGTNSLEGIANLTNNATIMNFS